MNDRSLIVETVTRWVSPLIFLYGCYIVLFGHLSPGGGFPGGVILACAFILILLAWGRKAALGSLPFTPAKVLESLGALIFLASAVLGLAVTGIFFTNVIQHRWPGEPMRWLNAGNIVINNIGVGIKVCAALFLVMLVLSVLRVWADADSEMESMEEE